MKVMLDTNICIYLIKRKPAAVLRRFQELDPGDVGLSAVTLAELEYGVAKSQYRSQNRAALEAFLLPLQIADLDSEVARVYGEIRAVLETNGTPIGALDTLIGAHAVRLSVPLVTHNIREFSRIPGLATVDWLASVQ